MLVEQQKSEINTVAQGLYWCEKSIMYRNLTSDLFAEEKPEKPDFSVEQRLISKGFQNIAGVDEVGRGPLAGPVVSAAVILDPNCLPEGLDDSKRLTANKRALAFDAIMKSARAISIASLCADEIDKSDIRKAALQSMSNAINSLAVKPNYVLVDGRDQPFGIPCEARALIKGDQRALSIAAASIIAKVIRDQMMEKAAVVYPTYKLENHVGYATACHRRAISCNGPIPKLHRFSFSPIAVKLGK